MIIENDLHRLAEADPARELDQPADEELLARLLAEPGSARPGASRRRVHLPPRRLVMALAVAGAVIAVVVVTNPSGPVRTDGSGSMALASQAYAKTSADLGVIVHSVATFKRTETSATGKTPTIPSDLPSGALTADDLASGRIEEWHRGDETHRIETYYSTKGDLTEAMEHLIDADGVMRQITKGGDYRIIRATDNDDAANVIAEEQSGFIEQFRSRYERGQLDPGGDVEFAGRPARRYVVTAEQNTPKTMVVDGKTVPAPASSLPPGPEQAFYIDRETAQPLGYTSTLVMNFGDGRGEVTTLYVETVERIEQLAPTAKNLAALRTFILPRRRDADGCVRGPIAGARSSDAASKTDCGGTPGAVVEP